MLADVRLPRFMSQEEEEKEAHAYTGPSNTFALLCRRRCQQPFCVQEEATANSSKMD